MSTSASNGIKRGQTVAFRVPSDTPDHVLKQLQNLKETEKRNFSSKIAEFVLQGVSMSLSRERETITIPLPQKLNKAQRDWLKHEHSEALLGSIIYQLISDPIRSASLLAALNSNSIDIDQALYLQEEEESDFHFEINQSDVPVKSENQEPVYKSPDISQMNDLEDDLDHFDWDKAKQEMTASEEQQDVEESIDDLLGGFLAHMNK